MVISKPIFNKMEHRKQKRNHIWNIIWLNPPFSRNITTNVAKRFLILLDICFPKSNKLHKIFKRNTAKVSYCCTENLSSIIKTCNKKVTNEKITWDQCNWKNKNDCLLDGNCQTTDIIYECTVSTTVNQDKIYLGKAEGDFKKRYYNHKTSFKNREKAKHTLLKYVWEAKKKHKETLSLKSVPWYSNIIKKRLLCLHEKLEIVDYPNQEELLNKQSELISKCHNVKKYLLSNYKSNDKLISKITALYYN